MLTFITSSVKFVFATSSTLFWVSVTLGTFRTKIINIPEPENTFLEVLIRIKRIGHHAYKRDNASVSSAKLKVPHNPLNFSYKKLAFIRRTISKFNLSWKVDKALSTLDNVYIITLEMMVNNVVLTSLILFSLWLTCSVNHSLMSVV